LEVVDEGLTVESEFHASLQMMFLKIKVSEGIEQVNLMQM
jgi:hypothetical protein